MIMVMVSYKEKNTNAVSKYGKIPEYFQNGVCVTSDFEKVGLF